MMNYSKEMKKLILILLTILPLFGYADTLDYWSIYLNDSLIGQYNSLSEDIEIVLNRESIKQNDTISILYGNDHPCSQCEYYYAVKEKIYDTKLEVERRNHILKEVYFPLLTLKKFIWCKEFEFSVYMNSYTNEKDTYTILLRLRLE